MSENDPNTIEITRRTVIETGTTALLLTALPRAALAAGPLDDSGPPPPLRDRANSRSTAALIR